MVKDKSFGQRLRLLRQTKEENLSRHTVAEALGISYSTYCNWEQAKSMPTIAQLPKIATYYNLSVDALLDVSIDSAINRMAILWSGLSDHDRETVERIIESLSQKKDS